MNFFLFRFFLKLHWQTPIVDNFLYKYFTILKFHTFFSPNSSFMKNKIWYLLCIFLFFPLYLCNLKFFSKLLEWSIQTFKNIKLRNKIRVVLSTTICNISCNTKYSVLCYAEYTGSEIKLISYSLYFFLKISIIFFKAEFNTAIKKVFQN